MARTKQPREVGRAVRRCQPVVDGRTTAGRPDELDAVYERALAVTNRPALVHVLTEPTENCYPMWPAGQSIDTMVVEDPKYAAKSTKKKS